MIYVVRTERPVTGKSSEFLDWATKATSKAIIVIRLRQHHPVAIHPASFG